MSARFLVIFAAHVSVDYRLSLTGSLSILGLLSERKGDEELVLTVHRKSKILSVRNYLRSWQEKGFVTWSELEISN